ncbi:probable RNA-directed DNA polymerase from transposon BS [Trichonephila clavipes]|nr:probable RNA-directed DNA polymerase from transposon BS [Trichonephila clavipes]
MDTEHPPTTDRERCEKMSLLEEEIKFVLDRLNFLDLTLARMKNGKFKKTKEDFERILQGQRAPQEPHGATEGWKQRDAGLGQRSGASCPPKIPFIHLKFKNNYNLIMQEVTRKWPKSRSKLSGEFLKILASTADEHREITAFLTEKNEEFHAIDPIEVRPQKVVIKGLPISTDIDAIRADLTERGFNVFKVAQLTKAKSKFKLPIFMVELKKLPGSPDIFQLETCCFLTIKIDSFNRRPGATQCYNCNLFHHSSSNCHIETRCLKCGEPHKTGDCPIKSKIENPTCINCQQKGHLANSHRCPKFPKPKPKKGEASQNRNNKIVNNSNIFSTSSATVQKGVSFANAVKNDKQMAPPLDKSEPAQSKPEATPNPPKENRNRNNPKTIESENFGFMDAILELKKFFTDYPSLLELGRQLRNAQGNERQSFERRHGNFTQVFPPPPPHTDTANGYGGSDLGHLTPPGGDPLVITSLYISPSVSYQHIHTDVEALFSLGGASIICGDFNAHHTSWGCRRNDNRGNIIRNLIDSTDTPHLPTRYPTTPTRFGHNSASIIDFALTRNIHWLSQVESIAELSSDHNPLIISFDTNRRFAFPRRIVTTDWAAFRELLSPAHYTFHPITARTGEDVDTQVADLTDAIINTHALSSKPIRGGNSYYVSEEIRQLMIERNRARKVWQFTRDPSDKRVLNNIQNRIHRKVKAFQNKTWEDELRALDPDDGSLWEMSKEFRKKKSPVYVLNGQGGIAHTDSDKAAVIACSLEKQFQENNITHPSDFIINRVVENYFLNENNFDAPSPPSHAIGGS